MRPFVSSDSRVVLRQKVFRIGLQRRILDDAGRVFIRIDNRTYHSEVEIRSESIQRWLDALF